MLKVGNILEMRASKRGRGSGLERAAEKQLGRKQRGELHVESRTWGCQISAVGGSMLSMLHGLGVDRRNVAAPRVPISEARDVGSESAMGEARIAVGRLRGMAEAGRGARPRLRAIQVLHPEKMRRDQRVPSDVR